MPPNRKSPFLLFTAHPLTGHLNPTLRLAASLASTFPHAVYFLGPFSHAQRITSTGVSFLPLMGTSDLDDMAYYSPAHPATPDYWGLSWQQRGLVDFERIWVDLIPDEWGSLVAALEFLNEVDPRREVILVVEAMFFGVLPLFYGGVLPPEIKTPRTVCVSVTVPFIRSVDIPAFFVDRRDGDEDGWARWGECTARLKARMDMRLREVGATRELEGMFLSGQNYICHERILQLGVPGWFFPRGDWPAQFRFVGVLPPAEKPKAGWPNLPVWWEKVTSAKETGKKVVVVAQGTVEVDPSDLIVPTILAMASREDVLVVAILGRKGASLPHEILVPGNARVTDYLHYDAVLPYTDAWVHNGGYGAVQHGIAHGVPMVVAGEGQDKTENAKRIAWSGAGVNLGRVPPSVEDVRHAVGLVLDVGEYRERAEALRKESAELVCFDAVEREILAVIES